jgi:hypothetical protein
MSNSYLNGTDWTKQLISKIPHLMQSQWIYCNILLHNRRLGYLCNKQAADLLREIQELLELSPDKVPESSHFLLEINFTELTCSHLKTQWYWTFAVHAALKEKQLEDRRGARLKWIRKRLHKKIPSRKKLGKMVVEQQIRADGMHQLSGTTDRLNIRDQTTLTSFIQKSPRPSSASIMLTSNKRLCKLD